MNRIGIIGGSSLYQIEGLDVKERKTLSTPFGEPSDEFVVGNLAGREVVFLPRHQRTHSLLPTEINYRANIFAMKMLGVDRIISVSAVGSLQEEVKPLDILLVDQFIDRTNQGRSTTFFGDGIVAHVAFAQPVCMELKDLIYEANKSLDVKIHDGGTYINMEGPAFSTKAESYLYKSWGADVIGMTNIQEARLAREAGICYSTIAMVTDYDCWHLSPEVETVSVDVILENLSKNAANSKKMLLETIKKMPVERTCTCGEALRKAIVTARDAVPAGTLEKLKPILEGFI
ncbi:MAG: S-methyl-5'-thioadenosine phosphorylase [Candidatus Omnitrophica bacterium]|nr:S-methyl-5'-thioadenosine phosphorylase [Candidatus Omnitrophota bacterium]